MQQVFQYVNELFIQEKSGRDGDLRIVTYNIQPTSPTTGVGIERICVACCSSMYSHNISKVLEWVVDTVSRSCFRSMCQSPLLYPSLSIP